MKFPHLTRILFLFALSLSFTTSDSAASFNGKVTEVMDGQRLTAVSLNQPLKVKLLGVAAPEKDQPYTDVARQHLSDLLVGKYVVVRYTALESDGYLMGRVTLNDVDIAAQMIRDGVAWYDKADEANLSEQDRHLYMDCEKAARSEGRGLWTDPAPVAPWEFRKAQLAASKSFAALPTLAPARAPKPSRPGLSSEDMMRGLMSPGTRAGKPTVREVSPHSPPNVWVEFENEQFSLLVPGNSVEITEPAWENHGKILDAHTITGTIDRAAYTVAWLNEPKGSQTDLAAAEGIIANIMSGMNKILERGSGPPLSARPGRELRLAGYVGRQYSLSGGLAGTVRIFSRAVGDQRQEIVLCVLYLPSFESSGEQFLNSFKIKKAPAAAGE